MIWQSYNISKEYFEAVWAETSNLSKENNEYADQREMQT